MAEPLTGLRVREKGGVRGLDGLRTRPVTPGTSPHTPLNEQGVTNYERSKVNTLGLNPDSIVNWLQDPQRGYEAVHIGGDNYAVRKPGGQWKRLDPTGAGDWWKDLTFDALNEYGAAKSAALGFVGGAGATSASGPGAVAFGLLGAGAATSGYEALRQAAARGEGFKQPASQIAKDIAFEGALGAAGEGIGVGIGKVASSVKGAAAPALQGAGRALQRPAKIQAAKDTLGAAIRDEQASRALVREAGLGVQPYKEGVREATAKSAAAGAERKAAALEVKDLIAAKYAKAQESLDAAIQAGKAEADGLTSEASSLAQSLSASVKQTTKVAGGAKTARTLPHDLPRPDYGFTAAELEANPEIAALLRKHYGDEFVPSKTEIGWQGDEVVPLTVKRGSYSMANRSERLARMEAQMSPEGLQKAYDGFTQDMAAYMLGHPEYRQGWPAEVVESLKKVVRGEATPEAMETTVRSVTQRFSAKATTPRMIKAQRAYDEASIGQSGARAKLLGSEEAKKLAGAQALHQGRMAASASARAAYSSLSPGAPYADFGATWLGGRLLPKSLQVVAEPVGRAAQKGLAATGRGMERLGKLLAEDPGRLVSQVLSDPATKPRTRALAQRIASMGRSAGARSALVQALLRDPDVREKLTGDRE